MLILTELNILMRQRSEHFFPLCISNMSITAQSCKRLYVYLSVSLCPAAGQAVCVCPCSCLCGPTRVSASVKHRRLAPPPLHFHNIRCSVTVCCGLRTLITRQGNNVEGEAVQHHLRSLNPRGPAGWLSGFTRLTRGAPLGLTMNKLAPFQTGSLMRRVSLVSNNAKAFVWRNFLFFFWFVFGMSGNQWKRGWNQARIKQIHKYLSVKPNISSTCWLQHKVFYSHFFPIFSL